LKKRIAASLWFRSVDCALRTNEGYEAMNMVRKGQIRWLAKGDVVGQVRSLSGRLASPHNFLLDATHGGMLGRIYLQQIRTGLQLCAVPGLPP
jgi:hypothetical protein